MKYWFTADWHNGEIQAPHTHSFLRPKPTDIMVLRWLEEVIEKVKPEDTIVFVGDLGIELKDYEFYKLLPPCKKYLVLGDKEYNSKHFTEQQCLEYIESLNVFTVIEREMILNIHNQNFQISHKPSDCFETPLPAICGHIHGIWRTQKMNNGFPIINVGIDSWGQIVSEELLMHQYNAVAKGYYDHEAYINYKV